EGVTAEAGKGSGASVGMDGNVIADASASTASDHTSGSVNTAQPAGARPDAALVAAIDAIADAAPGVSENVDISIVGPARTQQVREELRALQLQLREMQGDRPLVLPSVDAQAVAEVISDYTGIPVGR